MPLDLTPLKKATHSLNEAVANANNENFISSLSTSQKKLITAGVIQNFEFTYELCWKFMKRWLAENLGKPHVDGVTRRELFRLAAAHQLIHSVEEWMFYHQARNQTSHTYDENTANEVLDAAKNFALHANNLFTALTHKND